MFGSQLAQGRVWKPKVEISADNVGQVPHEELIVDDYLPAIGSDPFDPAGSIAIPLGRFVSIGYSGGRGASNYRFAYTDSGKTTLTLHDGQNLTPCGFSVNQMYKAANDYMTDSNTVKFRKGFVAEVPFVLAINTAHGTIKAGDKLTGYWGSTTSTTTIGYVHRGKPVKWNALTTYSVTAGASAQVNLTAAIYPGMTPTVIAVYAAGSLLTTATSTVTWNANAAVWVASFTGTGSGTVTTVLYTYGQNADQIAGEALRIQSLTDILSRDDFLKWVEYAPQDYLNFPPAMQRFPVTTVGTGSDPSINSNWETPSTVVAGSQYRVANYPMATYYPAQVAIQGTITDMTGNTSTYSSTWFVLPTGSMLDQRGYFIGAYHTINWFTGVIQLASNISSVTAIRVLYSYLSDPRGGAAIWGAGVHGLTDGRNVTVNGAPGYGVPSNLNLADVVASFRLIVY
jgi:hypothetical protein